jgi:hypothetical protein
MILALGAGGVYVAKRGSGAVRRAVGWTAERAGFITGRMQESLAETRRLARERYEDGLAATRSKADSKAEGGPASTRPLNGTHAPPSVDRPPA